EELKRIFKLYDLTMLSREDPSTIIPIVGETARRLQQHLTTLGYYSGRVTGAWDAASAAAFNKFVSEHNFENKLRDDGTVWPSVLHYIEERATAEIDRRTHTAPIVSGALDQGPGAQPGGRTSSPKRPARHATGSK
ncbi:MAG: putative peptidoglycan binding domain-containing protein, partial [Thermoplasmata archaeon]